MSEKLPASEHGKPAKRRSEIPPETLAALQRGELATRNLVEWLAIDPEVLLTHTLAGTRLLAEDRKLVQSILEAAEATRSLTLLSRTHAFAAILFEHFESHGEFRGIHDYLAAHPSDAVRIWAAKLIIDLQPGTLKQRIQRTKSFAADPHFGVREYAWMALRPHLVADLPTAVKHLLPWTTSGDANLRRLAVEVLRPRGVWCAHINALKEEPEIAAPLLEATRSDSSRYVQLSVANWLNDASKSRPQWVITTCARWVKESPSRETQWIVHHAQRTLRKAGGKSGEAQRK